MANGGDIIIKGGSVDLQYDDSLYVKEGEWNHVNTNKKMTRVTVSDEKGFILYDSGAHQDGLKWEVRAHCE
jgi:hypothetical protein